MNHFYGKVWSSKVQSIATRSGTKTTGLTTQCASHAGAIECTAWYNPITDTDMVEIRMIPWQGQGTTKVLYRGPIGEYEPVGEPNPNRSGGYYN